MTTGEADETLPCGRQRTGGMIGGGESGGSVRRSRPFTTLSTIAIQAGQSQIVISVLKSGSLVHLQLAQVHPGLCEIGSNQEENQTLIQEQQQLVEKLKKHEGEVLALVENGRQTEQRRRRTDEGTMEQKRNKKNEEEEEVRKAMVASLSEGWTLLLRLLERRQEVLLLASDFYRRALQFADSIDRAEDLRIRPDDHRLTEAQLTYDSVRRDLLGKSLQVLTSSSALLQKLRQLQRTEALQRTGAVLQDKEGEEEEVTRSQSSRGVAVRLEELVEMLQDRRRRADRAVRLRLQQAENGESEPAGSEDRTPTVDQILVQNLQSESTSAERTDLQSDSRAKETRHLQPGSRADVRSGSRPETGNFGSGLGSDLKPESTSALNPGIKLNVKPASREENKDLQPQSRSKLQPESRSEENKDLQPESRSNLQPESRSEENKDLQPQSRSDIQSESRSEENKDLQPQSRSDIQPESRSNLQPEARSNLQPESRSDVQSGPRSDLQPGFRSEPKPGSRLEEIRNLQSRFKLNLKAGSRSDLKSNSKSEESRDNEPGSRSVLMPGSRLKENRDLQPESTSGVESKSSSEETRNLQSGSRLNQIPGSKSKQIRDVEPGFRSEETRNLESGSRSDLQPESRSEENKFLQAESTSEENEDLQPESRSEENEDLQSESRSEENEDLQSESSSEENEDLQPESRSEENEDLQPESRSEENENLQPESRSEENEDLQSESSSEENEDLQTESSSEENEDLQSESSSEENEDLLSESSSEENEDLQSESSSEENEDLQSESRSDLQPESRSDVQSGPRSDLQPGFRSEPKPGSRLEEIRNLQSRFKLNLKAGSRSDLKSNSKSEESRDNEPGSRSVLMPGSRLKENRDLQPESTSGVESKSRSEETRNLQSGSILDQMPGSRPDLKPRCKSEECRSEETMELQLGSRSDIKCEPMSDLKPGSNSEKTRNLQPGSRSDLRPDFTSEGTKDFESGARSDVKPRSRETMGLRPGSRSKTKELLVDVQPGSRSEAGDVGLFELSRKQEETEQHRPATATSGQVAGLQSMLGKESQSGEGHTHQALPTSQQQLLSSCDHLTDKVWSWVQQGSSVLLNSAEAGRQLFEAEDSLNTHLQLHTQAESVGHDAENLKQILDQIHGLHTDPTSRASGQPPPLKALTEQLKRGVMGRQSRASAAQPGPPAADPPGSLSRELAGRADLVLKELRSLSRKIDSNLQLLQPYVTFLRAAQQVEEEVEELREIYRRRPEEEEEGEKQEEGDGSSNAGWQKTLQSLLTAQELGDKYVHTVTMVSGSGLNLQSVVSVVRQTVEQLDRTKQEMNELWSHRQIQIEQQQEDMKYCRKYHEKLLKTLQDLNCVSELLDSCTLLDLGSDLQTSRLLERFSQARPHFIQLDTEVEYMMKNWETLREVQDRLEVKEEDLSELVKLQKRVKDKIRQCESVLDLTTSFHLTAKQLEALLSSDPASPLTGSADTTGFHGSGKAELSRHREEQQQLQSLFKTASTLKTDICTTVTHSGWAGFRLEQLEACLLSLDSLCVSWLKDAAQCEEKLRRELLIRLINDDINQLRDSFKELKKRFSNLKYNYLKRNDRTRNTKAVRNQLQQVELYEEKLQVLRKRLQGVTARVGSEVKDGGVAREVEDAVNELQRQMGEFERTVREHQKTLDMTSRLQQAMEEYQFWCEEASATIARVGKFSSECRSTEAVSVLHRQFEKFVWPTVPQQEERISQITELAVRLHGAEEGRRYIEKTVSKHSEMVQSIRELSDGLMELEAKLKLENLKQQQNDKEKEMKEEGEMEQRREKETEQKDEEKENKLKEDGKMKKKEQTDNRSAQEAADMHELKETGHTPELTAEHDGKEVPVKRQTAANRKPLLQKSCSQEADRQTVSENSHRQLYRELHTSSYCSTHTFSLSCSPVQADRQVHAISSQLQPVATEHPDTTPPPVIGPLSSVLHREFQRKEIQEMGQQGVVSPSCGLNMTLLQNASAAGLSEAELQQQEVMTEDSLSNDEYECVSPDDISLPSLAETPESSMVQSDIEEGFCFSSHSIHISQYSQQYRAQSEHSGTGTSAGAVRQQRESIHSTERYPPTPPASVPTSTRFRSESSSFVQSPLTVPAPNSPSSTVCNILRTEDTSTTNFSQSADLCVSGPEPNFVSGSNPVHKSNTTDSCYNKDHDVPERMSPSKTEPLLNDNSSQCTQPQRRIGAQSKSTNVTSKCEILPQSDSIPHHTGLDKFSYCPQPFNGPDPDPNKDKTPFQDTRFLKCNTTFPQITTVTCQDNSFTQSFPDSEIGFDHDINSAQTRKETSPVFKPQRHSLTSNSTAAQQTIYLQSSPSNTYSTLPQASSLSSSEESPLSQSKALPLINLVPQARGFVQSPGLTDSAVLKNTTIPQHTRPILRSLRPCLQTSTTLPQDRNLPQSLPDSRNGLDQQDVLSSQTSKETSSVNMPQQTVYCQASPSDSHCNVPQTSSTLRRKQDSPFSQGVGNVPDVRAPSPPEPNSSGNISISGSTIISSNTFSSKQSHQTVFPLHESLTSNCTQQCVHDPGMTPSSPAKPAAPPQPAAQTQALAQQAMHDTPPSSPPHLLTSDQDPDICHPMAIREEIRLTPQIQGPALPAPPLPRAQTESLPQGKASKPGPPFFTRPLSRATVMEGSPVTLEVEVTGHPEPMLTWFKDGDVSATGPGPALVCEDRKHFLFNPEASDSEGGLYEARAANHHDLQRTAGNSSSSDKWLVAEEFDIISVDWWTWFGTLCVLLWLLYLIIL